MLTGSGTVQEREEPSKNEYIRVKAPDKEDDSLRDMIS